MCLEDDFPIVHGHLLFPCLTQWVAMAGCFSNHETVATVWRSFLAIRHLLSIPGDLQIELDVVACNTALTVCDVQWQRALDILQQTQDREISTLITYSSAISCCEKARKAAVAVDLFEELRMAGHEANTIAFSAAVSACEKGQQWLAALRLLQQPAMQFLQRDVVLLGAQLSSLGAGQRWRQAEELHTSMAASALRTNRICGNALLSAYEKPLQWRKALEAFGALECLQPDAVSFSASISCVEKCQQWHLALHLCAAGPRSQVALHGAMTACAGRAWIHTLGLLRRMKQLKLAANNVTYTAILEACQGRSTPGGQLRLLSEMKASWCSLDAVAYTAAADACDLSGDHGLLLDWLANCERSSLLLLT
ncbi:unnamed protein product [Cladocopium goreaui]|uniref:Pentatricopeptide repeat-containing protein, chloroplastic n=1 Tax=Cladocopium goreaui TaxID=2562237 RepID=A0A9P1FNS1_9DINO|nr:unnamed protein product [Cladocopium goreaui]